MAAREIMDSSEWKGLQNQLMDYVHNYQDKIVDVRTGFQF